MLKAFFALNKVVIILALFATIELQAENAHLPVWSGGEPIRAEFNCDSLNIQLAQYEAQAHDTVSQLDAYLRKTANIYESWRQDLLQYEGTQSTWPKGFFTFLTDSERSLFKSSELIYSLNDVQSKSIDNLRKVFGQCLVQNPRYPELLDQLNKYSGMLSENWIALADFLAQMQMRLNKMNSVWRSYEEKNTFVAPDFFLFLHDESNVFLQAADLSFSNAGYIEVQFRKIRTLISGENNTLASFHSSL
jgi:hypothetical protein